MKRTLSGIAAAALLAGSFAPAAFAATTANYTDISGNFAQQDIITLTQQGFIHGYSDGTFRPNALVTRGQFLAYFLNVAKSVTHVQPGAHAQYYSDIPPRNWDYNYIGAAQQAGWINPFWINVKLHSRFNENYQASWGDAASFFVAAFEKAGLIKTTNGMAPLAYAKSIGLFNGIPSNQNQIYLNRASASVVLANILKFETQGQTPTGATVTLSGGSTMAGNTNEALSVSMKDASGNPYNYGSAPVTYAVTSNGAATQNAFVSSSGQFVATAAGTYNVTATIDGVTSSPLTITVYGQAAGVKLSTSQSSFVADGQSGDTVIAQIVDGSGNPVTNFNGTMTFTDTSGQLVTSTGTTSGSVTNVPVTNGVAKINLKANMLAGSSDTITGTDIVQTGSSQALSSNGTAASAQVSVTEVAQQAASLKVVPSATTVENNQSTQDAFTVQVLDQNGQPMLTGVYPVTLSVSGPGQFTSNTATSTAYVGNGSSNSAVSGMIQSVQGQSGAITVTASSQGLQSGSAQIQSTVVGSPAAVHVAVNPNSSGTITAGSSGGIFDVTTVDANGNTVSDPNNSGFSAQVWQGSTQITSGVSAQVSGNQVTVSGTKAGSYTLKVFSSDNLTPASINFTIQAASASKVAITSPAANVDLPMANNTTNIVAQIEDAYGNPVAQANVPVQFTVTNAAGSDTATLGGSTSGVVSATSNSNGQITLPFVGSHAPGDAWNVSADQVNGQAVSASPVRINMVNIVPTSLKIGMQDTATYSGNNSVYLNSPTTAQAGDTVTVTITPQDAYGNASTNGDLLQITLPAGLTNPQGAGIQATSTANVYTVNVPTQGSGAGTVTFNATASQAGPATVSVQDLSVGTGNVTGSASMNIVAGAATGAALFNSSGQEVTSANELSVTAQQPVQLFLRPVDSQGNSVIEGAAAQTFNLSDNGAGGNFRLSSTGSNVSSVQLPAGSSGVPVYYVNPSSTTVLPQATLAPTSSSSSSST